MNRSIGDRARRSWPRSPVAIAVLGAALLAIGPVLPAVRALGPSTLPSGPLEGIELLVRGERDPDLVVPDEDLAAAVRGNTAFALALYRQVASQPGNLVTGPLSISFTMAMHHRAPGPREGGRGSAHGRLWAERQPDREGRRGVRDGHQRRCHRGGRPERQHRWRRRLRVGTRDERHRSGCLRRDPQQRGPGRRRVGRREQRSDGRRLRLE